MSLLIGIKGSEYIRYISVEGYDKEFEKIVAKLLNFYKTSEKVTALINLGNLEWLGASPYKKYKGNDDNINCESKIRDRKLSEGKHGACIVNSEREFVKKMEKEKYGRFHCCFLFEDNSWYILVGARKERLDCVKESFLKKDQLMAGLKVYNYRTEDSYRKLSENDFMSWDEVKQAANEKRETYYVFRLFDKVEKLLAVIIPIPQSIP